MKIASWNINGVKARMPRLLEWLKDSAPDVALLQEVKSTDELFPSEPIEDLGYNVVTHGQKGFNGVAILSKFPIEDVSRGLPGDDTDEQARWIEATISGDETAIRLCNLYLPNGNPAIVDGEFGPKYHYKLDWMKRLKTRAKELLASEEIALMAGDYNIIPQPEDAAKPDEWLQDALYLPESRTAWREILNLGFTEAFRTLHPDEKRAFTFWDYQAGAWQRDQGIRIDHFLLTPQASDRMVDCHIEKVMREGEKPSDHVPIWCEIRL